jgi:hypothetical protein
MDFNTMPKLIAEKWHLGNNRNWFFVGFSSGTENSAFLLPPPAAKGLFLELEKRIKSYEKEFGAIDMTGITTEIQSPYQVKR